MPNRLQILHLARPLSILLAGTISLYPAIPPQHPFLQDSRYTPTNAPRVRSTTTSTLPPRLTNTSPPPIVHSTDTETPPLQSASATPTATINQEIQPSDTPTPTSLAQTIDIAALTPTPISPGSNQPENPINAKSLPILFGIMGVILGITSTILVVLTFGAGSAGLIAAAVILAGALIGGAISSATGGDFLDGVMLGAILGTIPAAFTSFITNILRLLKKKKKRD